DCVRLIAWPSTVTGVAVNVPVSSVSIADVQSNAVAVAGAVAEAWFTCTATSVNVADSNDPTDKDAPTLEACTANHRRVYGGELGASVATRTSPEVIEIPKLSVPTFSCNDVRAKVSRTASLRSVAGSNPAVPSTSASTTSLTTSKCAEPLTS